MLDAQRECGAMISSSAPLISTRNFSPRSISFRAAAFRSTNSREIRTVFRLNISSSHSATTAITFSACCVQNSSTRTLLASLRTQTYFRLPFLSAENNETTAGNTSTFAGYLLASWLRTCTFPGKNCSKNKTKHSFTYTKFS